MATNRFQDKICCRLTRASNAETHRLLGYIAWKWDRYLFPQNVFLADKSKLRIRCNFHDAFCGFLMFTQTDRPSDKFFPASRDFIGGLAAICFAACSRLNRDFRGGGGGSGGLTIFAAAGRLSRQLRSLVISYCVFGQTCHTCSYPPLCRSRMFAVAYCRPIGLRVFKRHEYDCDAAYGLQHRLTVIHTVSRSLTHSCHRRIR